MLDIAGTAEDAPLMCITMAHVLFKPAQARTFHENLSAVQIIDSTS
jgi:hypothetical protein